MIGPLQKSQDITLEHLSKIIFFSLILLFSVSSCHKANNDIIPDTYVDFVIDLNDPRFTDLNGIGNSLVISAAQLGIFSLGYNNHGILIYRASEDEFYAFDRTCPYEKDLSQSVQIDNAGDITAQCPECQTEYILPSYGYPTDKGPGTFPLKMYRSALSGRYLHVYNN